MEDIEQVYLEEGDGKYVLVCVSNDDEEQYVVRQDVIGEYHIEVFRPLYNLCGVKGYRTEVLGGGRITFLPAEKRIVIYERSLQFGRADHSLTKSLLLKKYPDFDIRINEPLLY